MVGQADMMQARWGSHGDYQLIALCPQSPQEAFDLTIDAFNLAETYRTPVLVMLDECVGHMTEKVVIPEADTIEIVPRRLTAKKPDEFLPYQVNGGQIPEFARAGDGYRFHTTGLTHDERGYPATNAAAQAELVPRLIAKIRDNRHDIIMLVEDEVEDADVVVVAYGISARTALLPVQMARKEGLSVGLLKLVTVWPLAEDRIRELAGRVKAFVVPEINMGQLSREVERCAAGQALVFGANRAGGDILEPQHVLNIIRQAAGRDSTLSPSPHAGETVRRSLQAEALPKSEQGKEE